jgi:predicted nucleic acid-binding Zn ribbon protein
VDEPDDEGARAETHDEAGLDLARAIARGLAGRTGPARPTRAGFGDRQPTRASGARASGAHPDERDPQTIDATLGKFVTDRGWETNLRVHGVFSRWSAIVGDEVSQHVTPEAYADGRLTVRADSTAWATQMKLLAADVVRRLNEVLGDGTVLSLDIQGPHLPSWTKGRLRVKGRGARDTFG